jgi:NADPH2:quinone reductase
MPKAVRFHKTGGPEVLVWEDVEVGDPGPGQIRLRHHAVGLNYLDTYQRSGLYPMQLPSGCGNEGAGVVEAVGAGVSDLKAGDRVAYAGGAAGAYAEARLFPADRVVKIPDGIAFETAAAMMLKGMTVQYLVKRTFKVQPGMTVLWHAAAGGVGLIACQWLKALGVSVIGTVGSDEKAALVKAHGCEHAIVYTRENFVERVKAITGGKGVPVVYDSVGKDTLEASLNSLQVRGTLVSNGTTSGPAIIDTTTLAVKGSLWVTRPAMVHYATPRSHMLAMADELFGLVLAGKIKSEPNQTYPLADAAEAHRALESRKTTGATVLLP